MAEVEDKKEAAAACGQAVGDAGAPAVGGTGVTAKEACSEQGAVTAEYRPLEGAEPRIGVFICSCGKELSRSLDLPAVEADCRKIPGVVFAGVEPYPCSRPGLAGVREVIAANGLNRAVIAGCTPRLHGRLFAEACEKAGLNRWLVDFANIREHCGRVHTDRARATEKAKDLVRGAVSRVTRARPLEAIKVRPLNSVLVIGGGISGLTVAARLAQSGHEVTLVEKSGELGGSLARVRNVYPFARSGSDVVRDAVASVEGKVEILKNTTVNSLRGAPGQYTVTLGPLGAEAPGASGAHATVGGAETPDAGRTNAAPDAQRSFGAVVVATGADWVGVNDILVALQRSDPTAPPVPDDYLRAAVDFYRKLPAFTGRVLTQAELERELASDSLKAVRKVLFLNLGHGARSDTRLDSLVALKNAIVLRHASPGTEVTFVFDRIPSEYERDFRRAGEHGVKFVRTEGNEPPDFMLNGLRLKVTVNATPAGNGSQRPADTRSNAVSLEADLIVIPTILAPSADARALAKILRIPVDSSGLYVEPHVKLRHGDFAERAVFVVGACHGPVTVFECLSQAGDAASRATRFLKSEVVRAPLRSDIDARVCRGCSRCAHACDWMAIQMVDLDNGLKLARVDEEMCTGCGVCAMVCICGAPVLTPVRREHVKAAVGAMFDGR